MKILLVHARGETLAPHHAYLVARGWTVLTASRLDDAISVLRAHGRSINIAVLDWDDPALGNEFVKKFRMDSNQTDLPTIFFTARNSDQQCVEHQNGPFGANAYLRLPFEPSKLAEVIENVVGPESSAEPVVAKVQAPTPLNPELSDISQPIEILSVDQLYTPEKLKNQSGLIRLSNYNATSAVPVQTKKPAATQPPESNTQWVDITKPMPLTSAPPVAGGVPAVTLVTVAQPSDPAFEVRKELSEKELQERKLPEKDLPEKELMDELPYLFGRKSLFGSGEPPKVQSPQPIPESIRSEPDSGSSDTDMLKKYLSLRERDVGVLSTQLKSAKDQIQVLEKHWREEKSRNEELMILMEEKNRQIKGFDKEKVNEMEMVQSQLDEVRFEAKSKEDRVRSLQKKVKDSEHDVEMLKERVRMDIRQIRTREKDLENRLEILRKDSEVLLSAREGKIIELKRKLDLAEFNLDLINERYAKEKEKAQQLKGRLSKAAQAMRVAGGFLGQMEQDRLSAMLEESLEGEDQEQSKPGFDKAS